MKWSYLLSRSRTGARHGVARGQALVEFALMLSIILLLVAAATDEASLLNDHLSIVYATRQGARTASVLGTQATSDCAAVGAIHAALTTEAGISITRIVIYKAGADGRPVSSTLEDIYQGNSQCTSSNGVATISPSAIQTGWLPANRSTTPFYEDSVGIELDFSYTFQFQLLGSGTVQGTDYAVMPLEAAAY